MTTVDRARALRGRQTPVDRVFRGGLRGAGILVLLIMSLVGLFLTYRGWLALRASWSR